MKTLKFILPLFKKEVISNNEVIEESGENLLKRKLIDYRKNPPQPYNTEKVPGNVWNFPRVRYRMPEYEKHPTQKPIKLLERIIKASSNEGDTVLDPFSGTFTTSYVAKMLKRKSIGIEIDGDYTKIGLRRVLEQSQLNGEELMKDQEIFKFESNYQNLRRLALYELTEELISVFKLNENEKNLAYIQSFQDEM